MVFLAVIMFVFGFVAGVGVTLQRCSEDSINDFCENQRLRDEIRWLREQKGEPVRVAYICDRTMCEDCNPECQHAFDIRHAKNFEHVAENEYWEKAE